MNKNQELKKDLDRYQKDPKSQLNLLKGNGINIYLV